ncbi:hypothetical protein LDFHOB_01485 [Candidatus Electronema aureum]
MLSFFLHSNTVASFTGAWIETPPHRFLVSMVKVASFTGAWIETVAAGIQALQKVVASFTGAWIETGGAERIASMHTVASFTGAWIETDDLDSKTLMLQSPPSRGRGLKPWQNRVWTMLRCRLLHGGVD